MVSRDEDKFINYINNYIYLDQFNELYDPDYIEKDIRNIDIIARKLGPALIRATNYKLEIAKEERQKRVEIIERSKIETIVTICQRVKRRISLSNKDTKNYGSDISDETD